MKADFSRLRFDPRKHYTGVLQQQGRVSLDSDWNEDVLTRLHLLQQESVDIIGRCGVPEPGTAFKIAAPASGSAIDDFSIAGGPGPSGHFYAGGILCALEAPASYLQQPDYPHPPRLTMPASGGQLNALVYLEVWPRLVTYLQDDSIREVALNGPDTAVRIQIVKQVKVVSVSAAAVTCAVATKELPPWGGGTLTTLQPPPTQPPDPCRLPDPANYTGRENHLYRVEIHDPGDVLGTGAGGAFNIKLAQDAAAGAASLVLASALNSVQLAALQRSKLITLAEDDGLTETVPVSSVSASGDSVALARPLRLSFQTARNAAAAGGAARFKWSRDNASFAVGVSTVSADRTTLTVTSLGRDQATALREGDLVEICDDVSELRDQRGHLTYLKSSPDPDQLTVVLTDPLPAGLVPGGQSSPPGATSPPGAPEPDRHLILRRWDGVGLARTVFNETLTPDMGLGDGVQIQFGGSNLQPGDYWQFVARTVDGSIEQLDQARPNGIPRVRCPLAVVQWTAPQTSPPVTPPPTPIQFQVLEDCRRPFPALVDAIAADPGIHVTRVFARGVENQITELANDTSVAMSRITGGIDILCDGPLDPASVSRPTCFATLETPSAQLQTSGAFPGYQTLTLAANVSAGGQVISWRPQAGTNAFLAQLTPPPAGDRGYLMRVFLKGNFIWSQDPETFLDGDTFGIRLDKITTSLRLPSGDRRRGGLFEMWFWLNPPQPVTPFVFTASVAAPPVMRSEGLTELVADVVLVGTGGLPAAVGTAVPAFNIQVILNTTITSPLLDAATPPAADAVLLIDEPSVLNTTHVTGTGTVSGVGGGGLSYSTGAAPNVYLGRRTAPNTMLFQNVILDAPGTNATRTLRFKNLRINASQLGVAATAPSQAIAFLAISGPSSVVVSNPQQTVGFVQSALTTAVRRADGQTGNFGFVRNTGINPAVVQNPQTPAAVTNIFLDFTEGSAASFKVRSIGSGSPFTARPLEEAGYDNNGTGALPIRTGDPGLPSIGFVSSGTRFRAVFSAVPAGVRLFVTTRDIPPAGVSATNPNQPPMQAVLITSDPNGGGNVPPPTVVPPGTGGKSNNIPFAEVPITAGSGFAIWEWVSSDPNADKAIQTVRFGVILAAPPSPSGPGTASVRLDLAPVSTVADASSTAVPVPRFVEVPRDAPLFTATIILVPVVGGPGVFTNPNG